MLYPSAEVNHLDYFGSDHKLISVSLHSGCDLQFRLSPKRFMFENKWLAEEDFDSIMEQWQMNSNIDGLTGKLSRFSGILKSWASGRFTRLPQKIASLRSELNVLLSGSNAQNNIAQICSLEHEIEKLVLQNEVHWSQHARIN